MMATKWNVGATSWFGDSVRFWSLIQSKPLSSLKLQTRSGIRTGMLFIRFFRSGFWSEIEGYSKLYSLTQVINVEIKSIFILNPRILIPKRNSRLGFKLRGNQLEVGQEIEEISSEIIKPGIPILALKEVEIMSGFRKRKMHFCLVGEETWLVFQ